MGNCCKPTKPEKVSIPHHRKHERTMVSFDFESTKGQKRALAALRDEMIPKVTPHQEKRPKVKILGPRR